MKQSTDAIAAAIADLPAADQIALPNGSLLAVVEYQGKWALRRTDFQAGAAVVSAVPLPSETDGRKRLRALAATIRG